MKCERPSSVDYRSPSGLAAPGAALASLPIWEAEITSPRGIRGKTGPSLHSTPSLH